METNKMLRKTLLGGFNRRDVVTYISQISAARERETADLRHELERLSNELNAAKQLGGDASSLRSELAQNEAALSETVTSLHRAESELAELRAKYDTAAAKLAEYEAADVQLEEKLAELERVKARVTDIELDAHERANRIVDDANAASAAARAEADRLVDDIRWKYDEARGTAGRAITGALRELESMRSTLEVMMDRFGETGDKLSRVTAKEQNNGDD